MRRTMAERRVLVRKVSGKYRRSRKKERGRVLDEFVAMTGYNRSQAAWLLNQQGRKVWVNRGLAVAVAGWPIGHHCRGRGVDSEVTCNLTEQVDSRSGRVAGIPHAGRPGIFCEALDRLRAAFRHLLPPPWGRISTGTYPALGTDLYRHLSGTGDGSLPAVGGLPLGTRWGRQRAGDGS